MRRRSSVTQGYRAGTTIPVALANPAQMERAAAPQDTVAMVWIPRLKRSGLHMLTTLGDTYCGVGCVSNCKAVAVCGKDAIPAGKQCPLNTW
jgi:hypothetical protein